jgi:hypothetical protein
MIRKGEIEMDKIQLLPQEASEAGEASEQVENQSLNDATFEPRAYVEQVGDYRQAEAIQTSLTAVVDSVTSLTIEQSGVTPLPIPRTTGEYTSGEKQVGDCPIPIPSPAGEYTGEQVGTCPIPIPSPVEEIGQKYSLAGTTEVAETPLPAPAGETGFKEQVGIDPIPMPSPVEEIGQKNSLTGTIEVAETPLPAPAGERGNKEEVGTLPVPLPRPADGVVITPINLPDVQNTAGVEIGMDPNPVYMPKNEATPNNLPNMRDEGLASGAQVEVGNKEVGDVPTPIPNPERIGQTLNASLSGQEQSLQQEIPIEELGANQIVDSLGLRLQMLMDKSSQIESTLSNIVKAFNNNNSDLIGNIR